MVVKPLTGKGCVSFFAKRREVVEYRKNNQERSESMKAKRKADYLTAASVVTLPFVFPSFAPFCKALACPWLSTSTSQGAFFMM